jgi:phosphotransferase system enzyme I (PtsI)
MAKNKETQSDPQEEFEHHLQGAPVSEGIAIGTVFFFSPSESDASLPEFSITKGEVEGEIKRYRKALSSSREDLQKLQDRLAKEDSVASTILDSHMEMLSDPFMTTHMEQMIRKRKQNTESVFREVIDGYREKILQTNNSVFQERIFDVLDVTNRIMSHLQTIQCKDLLSDLPPNSIVFAKELAPSETASVQASRVSALVTQVGGGSSHTALIARAKGIPLVASIDIQFMNNAHGKDVIVNGLTGDVIINPNEKTLEKYRELQQVLLNESKEMAEELQLEAETLDGYKVNLFANVGSVSEVQQMHSYGAKGVGLFRSEFLLCENKEYFYSEEMQFQSYKEALINAKGLPVVIRSFDIGGDKFPELIREREKSSGALAGYRGIRFLLRNESIFLAQIRAVVRASAFGDIRLLIPHITNIAELEKTKALLDSVREQLVRSKEKVGTVLLGCLIEVPAAVLIADKLAQRCDFFSIGTNDLVHYVLGIDRSDFEMSDYYYPAHPAVIRMIKIITSAAKASGIPVTVCGEMASNPHFIPLLLGMEIKNFSCAARYLPIIKRIIRQCHHQETLSLAEELLKCQTPEDSAHLLRTVYRDVISKKK